MARKIRTTTLVAKANKLIEARYKFTLWEMRVFTRMVSLVQPNDKEFNYCKLYIKDLMDFYNSSSKEDYETIRQVPVALAKKQVEIMYVGKEGKRRWANVTLFPTVTRPADDDNDESNAYIELKFNEELKPMLLELKNKYRIYDIRNIIPLRSVYSIRLFELLKQYENTDQKSRHFDLVHLKEMLGLIETEEEFNNRIRKLRGDAKEEALEKGKEEKYPLYGDFKRRVLLKAQKDLKQSCDIAFSFEEVKRGRKVSALKFYIRQNKVHKLEETANYDISVTTEEEQPNELVSELYPIVKQWVSIEAFQDWVQKYPEVQLRNGIQYTLNRLERGDTIENIGGYLLTMIKQPDLVDPIQQQKEKEAATRQERHEKAAKKEELENTLRQLQAEYVKREAEQLETLLKSQPQVRATVLATVKTSRFAGYDAQKSDNENLATPLFAAAFRAAVKKQFPAPFAGIDKTYKKRIEGLKRAIREI